MPTVFDFAKQTVFLARDVQSCKADIKTLQQELRDLAAVVQRMAYEIQRNKENEQHEREKLMLRLELALRPERGLSAVSAPTESEREAEIENLKRENEALKRRLEALEQQIQKGGNSGN